MVPGLVWVFTALGFHPLHLTHIAIGTSLATIVVTGTTSAWAHHKRQAVQWRLAFRLVPGIIIGALIGALFADSLSSDHLRQLFGVLQIILALKLLLNLSPQQGQFTPHNGEMPAVGTIIGAVASSMGIGGGALTGPYLIFRGQAVRHAVATASAVGVPIAIAGAIGFIFTGLNATNLPRFSSGYVYWPAFAGISLATLIFAPMGARLAHYLNPSVLKKAFAVLLIIIGIKMLAGW